MQLSAAKLKDECFQFFNPRLMSSISFYLHLPSSTFFYLLQLFNPRLMSSISFNFSSTFFYLLQFFNFIALTIILNPMIKNRVKMATKSQKVVCTDAALTLDTAAFTGNKPSMVHG